MARIIQGISFDKAALKKRQRKLLKKRLKNRNDAGYPKNPVRNNPRPRVKIEQTYWMENIHWSKSLTAWNELSQEDRDEIFASAA